MKPVVPAARPSKRRNALNMSNLVKRMDLRRAKATRPWMPRGPQFRPHREPMAVPSARPARFLLAFMFALLAMALGGSLLWSAPAQAQTVTVLIKNTGQTPESAALPLTVDSPWRAQVFTTGSNGAGYTLSSIGFDFGEIADTTTAGSHLEVTISKVGSDGNPSAELCTLTDPGTFSGSGVHTFAAPTTGTLCPTLTASTQYYAVIKRVVFTPTPVPAISLNATATSNEDNGGAMGWSIGDVRHTYMSMSSTWAVTDARSYLVEVSGSADNNLATGAPSISGVLQQDEELTADTAGIADADGLGAFSYQWLAGGAAISGATASTYTLTASEVGNAISLTVTFTDGAGNSESLTSAATDAVVASGATRKLLWLATLTVRVSGGEAGYSSDSGGALSPAKFGSGGTTYTVSRLDANVGAGVLYFNVHPGPGTDEVGTWLVSAVGAEFPLDGADTVEVPLMSPAGTSFELSLTSEDFSSWTDGTRVVVALKEPFNSAPMFSALTATRTLPENSGAGVDVVGGVVAATDGDSGDTLTYSLTGTDAGSFEIDSSGQISTKSGGTHNFDFEAAKNSYSVTVNVRDSKDAVGDADTAVDDTIAVTIDLTDVNEAPEITSPPATRSVAENSTAVLTLAATDVDASDTETWSVESGDDGSKFTINQTTGELTFTNAPDFETPTDVGDNAMNNTYVVTVKVADSGGLSDTHELTVTVTNVNEAPEITTISTTHTDFDVDENTATTEVIKTYEATDVDAATTLTWSLAGADAGDFTITKNADGDGELKFASVPNFEMPVDADTMNDYDIQVKVRDNGIPGNRGSSNQLEATVSVVVNVRDVNETPVVSGDNSPGFAEIEYDVLDADLTAANYVIATYSATDDDNSDNANLQTVTWDVSGDDAAHFTINSATGVLSFSIRPDFENAVDMGSNNTYEIVVEADDGQGESNSVGMFTVTVEVTNVDETPEITTRAASHTAPSFVEIEYDATMENLAVADYEARDEEEQTIAWSRTGADAGDFTIDGSTGVLSFAQRPDFEMPADDDGDNAYNITVRASDTASPANVRELEVVVTVTDVNERPDINEDTVPSYAEVEYDFTGTRPDVHTFTATDYDDMDTFEWSLLGTDAAHLEIGATTGILTFTQDAGFGRGPLPNFEHPRDDDAGVTAATRTPSPCGPPTTTPPTRNSPTTPSSSR